MSQIVACLPTSKEQLKYMQTSSQPQEHAPLGSQVGFSDIMTRLGFLGFIEVGFSDRN